MKPAQAENFASAIWVANRTDMDVRFSSHTEAQKKFVNNPSLF